MGEYAPFPWAGKYVRKGGGTIKLKVDWNCRRDTQESVTGFISIIGDILDREVTLTRFDEQEETETEEDDPVLTNEDNIGIGLESPEFPEVYLETEDMAFRLEQIQNQMDHLQQEFQSKLKYDAHKDKMIDNLHKELQEYKGDILKKYLQSMVMDIIQMIDNIRKLINHYHSQDSSESDPVKMLKAFGKRSFGYGRYFLSSGCQLIYL